MNNMSCAHVNNPICNITNVMVIVTKFSAEDIYLVKSRKQLSLKNNGSYSTYLTFHDLIFGFTQQFIALIFEKHKEKS